MVESGPVSIDTGKQVSASGGQVPWDERRLGRDEPRRAVTAGVLRGLSGDERRALLLGWPAGAAIVLAVTVFNILTRRHDHPGESFLIPVWDETSSALMTLVSFVVPAAVAVWMRRVSPAWWRAAPIHAIAAVCYSAVHVGGFVALRIAGFAMLGMPYSFGPVSTEVPYEFGKDVVAYAMAMSAFWLMLRWSWPPKPAAAAEPAWFEIRDGARLIRAPLYEIVAVRSAGNYVEFVLSDGRRPMMRASLASLETTLTPNRFVRTHRSWLVNAARVTGLRPERSGDYVVELGTMEVPLSRRWREALDVLRS